MKLVCNVSIIYALLVDNVIEQSIVVDRVLLMCNLDHLILRINVRNFVYVLHQYCDF
jgi:hypothetical protein